MKLILGGVRGTSTVADPAFMKYGGDTTSFLVEGADGNIVLIDVGTGIRVLADYIGRHISVRSALLLMTHYHFDHVAGFPSFPALYSHEWKMTIAAPRRDGFSVREVVSSLLAKPFWPLQIQALQSEIVFKNLESDRALNPQVHHGFELRWCPVHHVGGCTAYRFDEPATGASVVIATDVEWQESGAEEKKMFLDLCREPAPASCLVFDGHWRPDIYERFRGWGHSTWQDAAEIVRQTGVGRLILTHHDPLSHDGTLDALEADMQRHLGNAVLAREGMILDIRRAAS